MTAQELIALKTAVKTEMARRSGYGSLSTNGGYGYADKNQSVNYSSSTYDFSATPTSGGSVLAEHGQKTIDLILKINEVGDLKPVTKGDGIPSDFNSGTIEYVNDFASESITGS